MLSETVTVGWGGRCIPLISNAPRMCWLVLCKNKKSKVFANKYLDWEGLKCYLSSNFWILLCPQWSATGKQFTFPFMSILLSVRNSDKSIISPLLAFLWWWVINTEKGFDTIATNSEYLITIASNTFILIFYIYYVFCVAFNLRIWTSNRLTERISWHVVESCLTVTFKSPRRNLWQLQRHKDPLTVFCLHGVPYCRNVVYMRHGGWQ